MVPLNIVMSVELTILARQNRMISKSSLVARSETRNVTEQPEQRVRLTTVTALEVNVQKCRLRLPTKSRAHKNLNEH